MIAEIAVEEEGTRVSVRRTEDRVPLEGAQPGAVAPEAGSTEAESTAELSTDGGIRIEAPMVGTFYKSPEPGAKAYVAAGERIAKGQVLCIIEAMKIMNEIESEFAGVVVDVVADDAHPVEYGQVLFRIDPNG